MTNEPIFPKLTGPEMAILAEHGTMFTALEGQVLVEQGDPDPPVYAVLSGRLELVGRVGGEERPRATFGFGDITGDFAPLLGYPAESSLRAAVRSTVVRIELFAIRRVIAECSGFGDDLVRAFGRRSLELGSVWTPEAQESPPGPATIRDRLSQAVSPDESARGASDGIELVLYGDYQCPFTWKAQETVDSLLADATEAPLRYVFRHFPQPSFHPEAEVAARAAEAARQQGKFWEMHGELLALRGKLDADSIDAVARKLGLDLTRFDLDRESEPTRQRVLRDLSSGEESGVDITPAIFLDGGRYTGPMQKSALSSALLRLSQRRPAA